MLLWFNTTATMVAYSLIYLFCCGSWGEKVSPEGIRKWQSLPAHGHPLTSLLCLPRLYLKYWFSICLKTEAALAPKHFNARPVRMWHFPKRWRSVLVPLNQGLNPQRPVRCSATLCREGTSMGRGAWASLRTDHIYRDVCQKELEAAELPFICYVWELIQRYSARNVDS